MSTTYVARFGIGYYVTEGEGFEYDEIMEIEDEVEDKYELFDFNEGHDGDYTFCLVIKEPFAHGLHLRGEKVLLDKELNRLGLEAVGEFGLVGGLDVY